MLRSEAYSVLSTPEERERYNLQLEQALLDEDDDFTGGLQIKTLRLKRLE